MTCEATGKKKYTRKDAKAAARHLKYYKKYSHKIPTSYKCKQCHYWHVGNLDDYNT